MLEVAADNLAARTLYYNAGYVQAGRRRDYYRLPDGSAVDALILHRTLPHRIGGPDVMLTGRQTP
ncbi:putative ribosomal-protein-alanine acetyltransferase [Oceaniovalibus guishaninsula JLT2003]|uniref:Putative ribosomal-protein-alanine acetyltransferase n=1 Tax=Oceaniovalibus guishaninsula JLT2003 TaxID=1231392 RepID=K2I9B8_9RHOB|nr:putative ribosomal-protein-alanine acetyltransferase [Oceaniovalibus guishaninsula JLT2003]